MDMGKLAALAVPSAPAAPPETPKPAAEQTPTDTAKANDKLSSLLGKPK